VPVKETRECKARAGVCSPPPRWPPTARRIDRSLHARPGTPASRFRPRVWRRRQDGLTPRLRLTRRRPAAAERTIQE